MYNAKTLKEQLLPVVGWRQNPNPDGHHILPSIMESQSGLYFQDEHPLLTLDNLQSIAPSWINATSPVYDAGTTYEVGSVVSYQDKEWEAVVQVSGVAPNNSAEQWVEYDGFTKWLRDITESGIVKAVQQMLETKQIETRAQGLVEEMALFDGTVYQSEIIPRRNRTVGLEFEPVRMDGIVVRLDRVGLQFEKAGNITLILRHSSAVAPLQTATFEITEPKTVQWFDVNWSLPYWGDHDIGGTYSVEYEETSAPGDPINKAKDWGVKPCDCNPRDFQAWSLWSQFVTVTPYSTADSSDIRNRAYMNTENFGLNFTVSVECDLTAFIVRQKKRFQSVIAKTVAVDLLRSLAYNPNSRVNRSESSVTRTQILYEIDGDSQGRPSGIKLDLSRAQKAIDLDLSGINKTCLPCKRNGVRWR